MEATIQTYVVQPIALPILPTSAPNLTNPVVLDAVYDRSSGYLTVTMTIMIPGDLNPNQVSVKQYYSSSHKTVLEFYAVYSSESTADTKSLTCSFKASPVDAAGSPIELGAIMSVCNMLVNSVGPKTSRGTVSTVRTTED